MNVLGSNPISFEIKNVSVAQAKKKWRGIRDTDVRSKLGS
jgi:hypothetical protein